MRRLIIVIFSLTVSLGSFSQNLSLASSVVSVSGNYKTATNNSLSWTVGEAVVDILTSSNYMLTVGFQQNWERIIGIDDLEANRESALFPNPGNGIIFIRATGHASSELLIELFDLRGIKVYSERKNVTSGDKLITLDVSNLKTGMYFLHLNYPGGIPGRAYKFIIN